MKKFSTFNGFFTHCPTFLEQNADFSNAFSKNVFEQPPKAEETTPPITADSTADTQPNMDFSHYPQSNYDVFGDTAYNNIKIAKDDTQNKSNNFANSTDLQNQSCDNISDNTQNATDLSQKAKYIFRCMTEHDNIIRNIKN